MFKKNKSEESQTSCDTIIEPRSDNFILRIAKRFFNLSLFIKIGIIIGLCFWGYLLMAGYFFVQLRFIKGGLDQLEKVYLPHYKVGQIVLRHLVDVEGQAVQLFNSTGEEYPALFKTRQIRVHQEIKDGIKALQSVLEGGMVRDVSRFGNSIVDEFTVVPLDDNDKCTPYLTEALEGFKSIERILEKLDRKKELSEDQLKTLREEFQAVVEKTGQDLSTFVRLASGRHLVHTDEIEKIMERDRISSIAVAVILIGVLVSTGYLFIQMVLKPIKEITHSIHRLATGLEECQENALEVKSDDEIGQLSREFNRLIKRVNEFNAFKKIIEEDETVEDIYRRLAQVFKERLGLKTFAIFQVSNSDNKIRPVYLSPPDLEFNAEKLHDSNRCRAKRTGHIISSIGYRGICKLFLWQDEVDHICIPMVVGGRTVGVVQFLIPTTRETKQLHNIDFAIRQAQVYIREALPVIEAKRFAQSLKEMTLKDPLTDLYNRRFLETYIETIVAGVLRRGTLLSILMCDLDYFKEVNDTYGHEIGDEILWKTAQVLKDSVRTSDLVIRFGGEEFLVLLLDTEKGMAIKVAEKLRAKVEATKFKVPGGYIQKTISIGISEFPIDAEGVWEVIKYADVALYAAKNAGRNKVVRFKTEMWQNENY